MDILVKRDDASDVNEKRREGHNLSPDLVFELLLLLKPPVKRLLQLMLVSKVWRSTIRQPQFIEAYYNGLHKSSHDFLISIPDGKRLSFYYRGHQPEKYVELFNASSFDCDGVTQLVNGLFCFYRRTHVHLANVFTGQITELPVPVPTHCDFAVSYNYSLGFCPVNKVYKLLYMSTDNALFEFKILTLTQGEGWRNLVGPDYCFFQNEGILVNGVIYWFQRTRINHGLLSFDFSEEKFCSIRLPREDPREDFGGFVQFRGRLAKFAVRIRNREATKVALYTLEDKEGYIWKTHNITLPEGFQRSYNIILVPIGSLSACELLFMGEIVLSTNAATMPIYSYNYKYEKFEILSIEKLPKNVDLTNKCRVATLVSSIPQNIEMLSAMLSGGRDIY